MNPDPKFQAKRKYIRVRHSGASFVDTPDGVAAFMQDSDATEYELTDVWMTPLEFESLPEFTGF